MANSSNKNDDDFLAKAQAATQRVTASAATQQSATPEQAKIVQELAQDRPTIHAAITSFLSLVAARSLVAPEILAQQQQQSSDSSQPRFVLSNAQALQCSRVLLKAINATTLCATTTSQQQQQQQDPNPNNNEEEYNLVAQVWNGLVASEQKPARFLGRRALRHAWSDVMQDASLQPPPTNTGDDANNTQQQQQQQQQLSRFTQEFERLLFVNCHETAPDDDDDDAALIWDPDGGQKELERRRDRRQKRATNNATTTTCDAEEEAEPDQKLPFIEEVADEEDS